MTAMDADDASPQHTMIAMKVRSLINERHLLPGERLGTEREIAESLHISRAALRGALEIMESNFEIKRLIGRTGGIFVSDAKLIRSINTVESHRDIARRQGHKMHCERLSATLSTPGKAEKRFLELPDNVMIFHANRLRYMDGTSFSLDQSLLPGDLFPGFLDTPWVESMYGVFSSIYHMDIVSAEETFDVVPASLAEANLLGIPISTPLLRVDRKARNASGRVVERSFNAYIASRIRLASKITGYVRHSMDE